MSECSVLKDAKKDELANYVQVKYRLPSKPTVQVDDTEPDCYFKLRFASASPGNGFNLALLLSPDQNHLFTAAFDVRIDPATEERLQSEKRRKALLAGAKAIAGPESSNVAVVVYPDFQCPYCAGFWNMLKVFRASSAVTKATLYYRSFPLDGAHPWARTASLLTTCAQQQKRGRDYFLNLADFFFEEQRNLNSSTFKDKTVARLRQQPGFDEPEFTRCMSSGLAERQVADDIESARVVDVKAVPTIFINGHKIEGLPSPEHFMTILNQAIASVAADASPSK